MTSLPSAQIQEAIRYAGFDWIAADTRISELARARTPATLFGLIISESEMKTLMQESIRESWKFSTTTPPTKVDWRNKSGNWVTPVKNQATCGSCVAFATCGVLESRTLIAGNTPGRNLDLSESHLFSCGGGHCATGWNFEPALQQAKKPGVGLEKDFPYVANDVPCKTIPVAVRVSGWTKMATMNARKLAIADHGPVIAGMRVFSDFLSYKSGVYKHVTGGLEGLHAVAVVGYDDAAGCWIVKNSWDSDWGENGYVRMAYGQCGIDSEFPFFDPDLAPPVVS